MPQVTADEVSDILSETISDAKLEAAIFAAAKWVDENLVDVCTTLSNAELVLIEKYLAAHLAVYTEQGGDLVSSTRADVSERYATPGKGHVTRYISTAAAFDPCGIVREAWMDQKRARFRVGTTYQDDA